jgi:hypothetical protein
MSTLPPDPRSAEESEAEAPDLLTMVREIHALTAQTHGMVLGLVSEIDELKKKAPEFAENVQTQMTQTTAGRFVLKALGIE